MDFELSPRFVAEDFCRLCLSSIYELRMLFPREAKESNQMMISKISLLAEIIIVPSEELNARICSRCTKQLDEFDAFRRRCKDSDNQIRKIRAFRQRKTIDSAAVNQKERPPQDCVDAVTPSDKFGGMFNIMGYCEDSVAPGEHRMLFNGYVYRCESLLVWRCELAICPSQLIVNHDYRKFLVYGAHSHGKIPLENDKRKYEKMNQRICAFLNKLCNQSNGSCENRSEGSASSSGQSKSPAKAPTSAASLPQDKVSIYYSTKGDRPTIVANGYRYHKEAALSYNVPSQINWRCSEKNCLGMVVTTADLHRFRLHKTHNHQSSVKEAFALDNDYSLVITASPMMDQTPLLTAITPDLSDTYTIANIELSVDSMPSKVSSSVPMGTDPPIASNPNESSQLPIITMVTQGTANINALTQTQALKERTPQMVQIQPQPKPSEPTHANEFAAFSIIPSASNTNAVMNFQSSKDSSPPVAAVVPVATSAVNSVPSHSHRPSSKRKAIPTGSADPKQKTKNNPSLLTVCKPTDIRFCRCPITGRICLIHKKFVYIHNLLPTSSYITWQCKTPACLSRVHTGWQLEYLGNYKDHNHEPSEMAVVDVEQHLSVPDALKALAQLKKLAERAPKPRETARRKSTWS